MPTKTTVDEIADGVFRISTYLPDVTDEGLHREPVPPAGRGAAALPHRPRRCSRTRSSSPVGPCGWSRLRWMAFGHVESDECGALDAWLQATRSAGW